MKKVLFLLTALITIFTFANVFASESVTETPNVRIVIDGKTTSFEKMPITTNGRTLLPFREVLTKLGVPNDDQHIKWNSDDKSIAVNCEMNGETVTLSMKIDSNTISINGKDENVDVAPIIYKDSTYIPVRFASQALGKTVVWDGSTTTVLIRDTKGFNEVKAILEKKHLVAKDIKKFKSNMDMDMSMKVSNAPNNQNIDTKISIKQITDYDMDKNLMHFIQTMKNPEPGQTGDITTESYFSDGVLYTKSSTNNTWIKGTLGKELYDKMVAQGKDSNIEMSDMVCAGLALSPKSTEGKYVLEGNVYFKDMLDKMMGNLNIAGTSFKFNFSDMFISLTIDKTTNLVEKEFISMNITMDAGEQGKADMAIKADATIDYNSKVDISIPQEALNATEKLPTIN